MIVGSENCETPFASRDSSHEKIEKKSLSRTKNIEKSKSIRISDWPVLLLGTNSCRRECFTSLDISHLQPSLVVQCLGAQDLSRGSAYAQYRGQHRSVRVHTGVPHPQENAQPSRTPQAGTPGLRYDPRGPTVGS